MWMTRPTNKYCIFFSFFAFYDFVGWRREICQKEGNVANLTTLANEVGTNKLFVCEFLFTRYLVILFNILSFDHLQRRRRRRSRRKRRRK